MKLIRSVTGQVSFQGIGKSPCRPSYLSGIRPVHSVRHPPGSYQPTEQYLQPHLPYERADDTGTETSRSVLGDWLMQAWGAVGVSDHSKWLHPGCVLSEMSSADYETRGVEAVSANLSELRRVLGDLAPHVITTVAENNKAACLFHLRGTVKEGLAANVMVGSRVEIRCMMLATLIDGRIAHAYSFIDFSQLGSTLPAP